MVDKVFSIIRQNNAMFKPKQKHLTFAISYGSPVRSYRAKSLKQHEESWERSSKFCFTSSNVLYWFSGSLFGISTDSTLSFLLL